MRVEAEGNRISVTLEDGTVVELFDASGITTRRQDPNRKLTIIVKSLGHEIVAGGLTTWYLRKVE